MNPIKNKVIGGSLIAMLAIATPFTASHEGLKLKAYLDSAKVPTICYGETENVFMGMTATKETCDYLLSVRLAYFGIRVSQMVKVPISPETHASLTSFAYNIGLNAFQNSTLLKKLNSGDYKGACSELSRWTYAGGKQLNGLVKRRQQEKELCLKGL